MTCLPAKDIAAAVGVSEKRIRQRAAAEQWVGRTERVQGGFRKLFYVGALPADVRDAVALWNASSKPAEVVTTTRTSARRAPVDHRAEATAAIVRAEKALEDAHRALRDARKALSRIKGLKR